MKQRLTTFLFLLTMLALSCAVAYAAGEFEQAELTSFGEVYEINRDGDGNLYISDSFAGEIWRLDPDDSSYALYTVTTLGVQDAQADSSGRIWFTDGASVFGYIDPGTSTQTTWEIAEAANLWGLTFDAAGNVWMTEAFGSDSPIYRFNPATRQLCQYTLPGGSASYYILHATGDLWLANDSNNSIVRYDIATQQVTHWMVPGSSAPKGIVLDGSGNFWWADSGLGILASLDPVTNLMRQFTPPLGTRPWSLITRGDYIWYAENLADTIGMLDPKSASASSVSLPVSTISATQSCSTLSVIISSVINSTSGSLTWTGQDANLAVDQDGWLIYQLPDESPDPQPWDLDVSSGAVYITDQGRQVLLRLPEEYESRLFLPYIVRQ